MLDSISCGFASSDDDVSSPFVNRIPSVWQTTPVILSPDLKLAPARNAAGVLADSRSEEQDDGSRVLAHPHPTRDLVVNAYVLVPGTGVDASVGPTGRLSKMSSIRSRSATNANASSTAAKKAIAIRRCRGRGCPALRSRRLGREAPGPRSGRGASGCSMKMLCSARTSTKLVAAPRPTRSGCCQ